ncbi:MAG: hypothetical protein ACK559_02015, partial [bacterium]
MAVVAAQDLREAEHVVVLGDALRDLVALVLGAGLQVLGVRRAGVRAVVLADPQAVEREVAHGLEAVVGRVEAAVGDEH